MTADGSGDRRPLGWLLAGVGMLSVSTDSLWVRLSEADAVDVAFLVSCCALVVHSTFGRWFDRRPALESLRTHRLPIMGVGALASVSQIAFITAITETRVANVVAIVAAAPLMASLCARVFLGEPITRRVAVAISLTMADALDNLTRGASGAAGTKPVADIALVARLDPETDKLMVNTADGEPLPASVIDRLAGDSSLFGLVLSAKGVPIWKGRNLRRATESQFQALIALYGGCAGCDETDVLRIQAHHKDPFAQGGATDLDNLIPLCWNCHTNIHDHGWTITRAPDGKNTIAPPDRTHYGPAHLPDNPSLRPPPEPRPEPALQVPSAQSPDRAAVAGVCASCCAGSRSSHHIGSSRRCGRLDGAASAVLGARGRLGS